ncbi:hypothetical protein YN1_4360 [Nanoarchaeota archaeon]
MKNQIEIIYVILFLSIIIIIILLTFYTLSLRYQQNQVFVRYNSLNTISDYFLGYLYTSFIQQSYSTSYFAGETSWGQQEWSSYPPGCIVPPSCNEALGYFNRLLTGDYEANLYSSFNDLSELNLYYPYNVNFTFTDNYEAGIIGDCNEITSGQYNYDFPVQVTGVNIIINSSSTGSLIPFAVTANIINNPAFYLYNEGVQFAYTIFPYTSFQDCQNVLSGSYSSDISAQAFEEFTGNPYIQCSESIQTPNECYIPCQVCVNRNIACVVSISCTDSQYNVYYDGNEFPQIITISSVVYNENITYNAYLNCIYDCQYIYNATTGALISNTCNLAQQKPSCSSQSGITCNGNSENNDEIIVNYQYIDYYPYVCSKCVLGGGVFCGCQEPVCQPPFQCPETITPPTPNECINQ